MKYISYARKSSEPDDRQAQSIEDQLNILSTLTKDRKLEVIGTLSESKSAKAPFVREKFQELINRVTKGEASGIICWSLDRLTRNPVDAGTLQWLLQNGTLEEIVTPSKTFARQDSGLIMSVMAGMGNQFIMDLQKNTKRGLEAKANKGWLPYGSKAGYQNDPTAIKGNKTITIDPVHFPLIRKAWDLMLTGSTNPPQILETLNNELGYRTHTHRQLGGKPMARSQIYKIFTDPFYYGEFEYPVGSGKWYQGKHTPMITKEEFNRVQILLGRKGKPKLRTCNFFATGVITCGECGSGITAEEKWQVICTNCKYKFASLNRSCCPKCNVSISDMHSPTLLHYIYYHCTKRKNPKCTQGTITEDKLISQITKTLTSIEISDDFKNWAIKHLNELNDQEVDSRNATLSSLQQAYTNVTKRIDNLLSIMISPQNSDGAIISDEEFKSQKSSLLKEKSGLEEQLKITGDRITKWVELSEKTFNFARYAKHWFATGDLTTKRQILQGLGSNLTLKDKSLHVELLQPFQLIQNAVSEVIETSLMFEPEKRFDNSDQLWSFFSQNPTLLPISSLTRTILSSNSLIWPIFQNANSNPLRHRVDSKLLSNYL